VFAGGMGMEKNSERLGSSPRFFWFDQFRAHTVQPENGKLEKLEPFIPFDKLLVQGTQFLQ